ncbi:CBS domain-containing protein [Bradyrhizobium sp. RT7b]
MAAMMGGTMRSPLTGLFAVELTGDFPLIASDCHERLLCAHRIAAQALDPHGENRAARPARGARIRNEVMVTDVDTLPATMTVGEAVTFFSGSGRRHKSYPLIDADGQVSGLVGRSDVLRWRAESADGRDTLFDCASDRSLTLGYPDEPVSHLADRMVLADVGRVPIVERASGHLVGLGARKDLLRIRATARSVEKQRSAFFGLGRRSPSEQVTALDDARL